MTGTHKQQSYGHIAQGASETQVRKMRRNLKAGTNLGRTQSCLSTTLAWIYGSSYDPEVSTRVEQVAYWIDVWKTFGENKKKRIRHMWIRLLPKLGLKQSRMWSHSKGPISATICSVLAAGWKPLSPTRWLTSDKQSIAIIDGAEYNKAHILAQLHQDLSKQIWKEASKHPHSKGIEGGAMLQPAKRAKASLIKEGNYAAARAVDFLVCGVPRDPIIPTGAAPGEEHLCQRCDMHCIATRKHTLWQCAANKDIKTRTSTNLPGPALMQARIGTSGNASSLEALYQNSG